MATSFSVRRGKKPARSTFKILFYLKRNAPKKDGSAPVMCRIRGEGTISQFSCKLDVTLRLHCCKESVEILKTNNISISMTENGDPYENAIAERINGTLKDEWLNEEEFYNFE